MGGLRAGSGGEPPRPAPTAACGQRAVVEVLGAIYEVDFLGFSYGFRPGRSAHHAVDALTVGIWRKKVNWVLDADIHPEQGRWWGSVVRGHLAYYAVPGNTDAVAAFRTQVTRHLVQGAPAP